MKTTSNRLLDAAFPGSLALLVIAVPTAMGSLLPRVTVGGVLLLLITAYSGGRLAVVTFRGRARVLQLFFWTFIWIFLGLAPLAQLAADDWYWPGGIAENVLWRAASIVLVSLIAYDLGLLIARRRDTRELTPARRVLSTKRLKLAAVIAVVACLVQIARVGPGTILSDRAARAAASVDTAAGAIQQALLVSVIFVVAYLFLRAKRGGMLKGYILTTGLLVALTLFVSNPLSSSRYRFASVAVALLLALVWPATRRQMAALSGVLLLGLAFLFPLLNLFRKDSVLTAGDGLLSYLSQGDYDAFQQLANTVEYVDERGLTNGAQGLGALLFFVPRAVWPGKAIDTGTLVGEFRGYDFTNLSAPLQAEAYVNGGIVVVALFFVLFGFATSWLERRASAAGHLFSFAGLFIPIIASHQVLMLRGSLLQSMAGLAVITAVTWLCTVRVPSELEPGYVRTPSEDLELSVRRPIDPAR